VKPRNCGGNRVRVSLSSLALLALLAASANAFAQAPTGALTVVTHVDVVPDDAEAGAKLLSKEASDARKDPGCLSYEAVQQVDRPNHFTIVSEWKSRDAFEAASTSAHTKTFRNAIYPMLGSPFDERLHGKLLELENR
jgi:quinol monooxygenase YgiN